MPEPARFKAETANNGLVTGLHNHETGAAMTKPVELKVRKPMGNMKH